MARHELAFDFDPAYARVGALFGVTAERAAVIVDEHRLEVRYGPWRLRTTVGNVRSAQLSGPFAFLKTAGPPHLSLRDRGVSFATNGRQGLCLQVHHPVPAIDPLGVIRHPGLTVTVQEPHALAELVGHPLS